MPSKREVARRNVQALQDWIAAHDTAGDWTDYVRAGRLVRSEIARECGFARSVLLQNPAVKAAVEALEARLRLEGVLPQVEDIEAAQEAPEGPRDADRRRLQQLEARVAELAAENRDLRQRLRRAETILREAVPEGRRIEPGQLSLPGAAG